MVSLREYLPRDFARKPRSLLEISMWKATELKQFLLYTGPVVLVNNISNKMYKHFMLLSVSVRIPLSLDLSTENCDAEDIMNLFVKNVGLIYGMEFVGYNVHSLLHLAQDTRNFGHLDSISCFPFETFLGKLKKMVRRPQNPVQQIVRRIHEKQRAGKRRTVSASSPLKQSHLSGPVTEELATCQQYGQYNDGQRLISCSKGDNCFTVGVRILILRNIIVPRCEPVKALFHFFEDCHSFFNYPIDLACLGIHFVSKLSEDLHVVSMEELQRKMVLLPFKSGHVVLPQLH